MGPRVSETLRFEGQNPSREGEALDLLGDLGSHRKKVQDWKVKSESDRILKEVG